MTNTTAARAAAARRIWTAALRRVQPDQVIGRAIVRDASGELRLLGRSLSPSGRIRVLALGKAADAMARAAVELLGERLSDGLIVTKIGHATPEPPSRFEVLEAAHPLPDERSVAAGERIARFLAGGRPDDLVLLLVSGGASALAVQPRPPLRLDDIRAVTDLLQRAGAGIHALNAVRKRLDLLKGGGLARMAAPARVAALLMSDVVGDDPATIGGGPAAPDTTTWQDAIDALVEHGVWERAPGPVRQLLEQGARGSAADTAAPDNAEYAILATGRDAAEAAATAAAAEGYAPAILTTTVEGEARDVARVFAAIARECRRSGQPWAPPAALIWAGETTVHVRGRGRGGRNQEMALAAAIALDGEAEVAFASVGTDGTDGPTDAAGGFVDGGTAARARARGLDLPAALADNDSYRVLDALGALIRTGPTGTHVNDLGFALIGGGARAERAMDAALRAVAPAE